MSQPFSDLLVRVREYHPDFSEDQFLRAHDFLVKTFGERCNDLGETYISHALALFEMLLPYRLDVNALMSALLHDVLDQGSFSVNDLERIFGNNVANLVNDMRKLDTLKNKAVHHESELFRALFFAMAKDLRVVLMKLLDMLLYIREAKRVPERNYPEFSREVMDVFAPIAGRLGMYDVKRELEDFSFCELFPKEFQEIEEQLDRFGARHEQWIFHAQNTLLTLFSQEGIIAEVSGRKKGHYSMYSKLKRKNKTSIEEIFDVFAMRVILSDQYQEEQEFTGHLYTALGLIHSRFVPLHRRFKDYVAMPKVNGYRSLHTAVLGLGGEVYEQPTEIQIRSRSMHENAERGIASHWFYKSSPSVQYKIDWIAGLAAFQEELEKNTALIQEMKIDVFRDRIFVLTPHGDVKDLPLGATPVDFAYSVHTDLGHRVRLAKVNGAIVPLDFALSNGDVVAILTKKESQPNRYWLSFVKTLQARNKITSWFRRQDIGRSLREGRDMLNQQLEKLGKPLLDQGMTLLKVYGEKKQSLREREYILECIGNGSLTTSAVLKKIFSQEDLLASEMAMAIQEKKPQKSISSDVAGILVDGHSNMPRSIALCCRPTPRDPIVGYTTRGRGITIHKKNCRVLNNSETDRLKKVSWDVPSEHMTFFEVPLLLKVTGRVGLLRDAVSAVSDMGIIIKNVDVFGVSPDKSYHFIKLVVRLSDYEELDALFQRLPLYVEGILEIKKMVAE
ncbi:bifunctional (p)ppGpp synthetase/guanosine-3',5'-bis(diphosphate) 3'-pyrophosphohydrolase [Candidatus Peregrinibacteria bacterium]|nr:bifunctional (p)ppGpp synthetase/guanosine-3',5'-bis(diphosphate) 3'-pyrophosphohydrolase [Candidatus Peregrinibacteria bacterium]